MSHDAARPEAPPADAAPSHAAARTRPGHLWYRRDVLSLASWAGLSAALLASLAAGVRLLFPRVLFEQPAVFRAGRPEDYAPGEVSTRYAASHATWVVRGEAGLYALEARCTHLGCTPQWLEAEAKFKCPCHGSGFLVDGTNFEGPAPTPLRRLKIGLAADGEIVVDTSHSFRAERGEWDHPDALLRL